MRRPLNGLLRGIAWSTPRALADTLARARELDLHVALMERWTDVDRPEDLVNMGREIAELRAGGDPMTAHHCEDVLRSRGLF